MTVEELFKKSHVLSEGELLKAVEGSMRYGNHVYKEGSLAKILSEGEALVLGDIHGDINSLKKILDIVDAEKFLSDKENMIIFLGDYVDRGPHQYESLAFALLLRQEFGDQVLLLRGNHEPHPELIPYPHDFPYVLKSRFPSKWSEIYRSIFNFFQQLPIAAFSGNGLFFVHGGPPISDLNLNSLKTPSTRLIEEVLWSDPREDILDTMPSFRGAGLHFGKNITEKFLKINGLTAIIRGHEPCEGYKLNHGGKVITIFSRSGSPYWNHKVGYMIVPLSAKLTLNDLKGCLKSFDAQADFEVFPH